MSINVRFTELIGNVLDIPSKEIQGDRMLACAFVSYIYNTGIFNFFLEKAESQA